MHNPILDRYPRMPAGGLWVFGYGSLMWSPGFDFEDSFTGRIFGFHRDLCLWSTIYRGTERRPGLVWGLAGGGSCLGRAFRVHATQTTDVLEYLWEREMVRHVYVPTLVPVHLPHGVYTGSDVRRRCEATRSTCAISATRK